MSWVFLMSLGRLVIHKGKKNEYMHNTIVRIFQKLTTNLEMISLFSSQPEVNSFENIRFFYISLNGIQCLSKWILHFKNNDDFLVDDLWKDLTIVTTLFFLLPFDSKVNNTKIKKGENLQICSKTWKSENCRDRGSKYVGKKETMLPTYLCLISRPCT